MTKSRLLKTAIVAALIGVAGAASIAPASAHDYGRRDGYSRADHRGHRDDYRSHRHHRHFHRGWY